MIDYYTAKELGGNTRKISIMLAETGLEHIVHFIDLAAGVQQQEWFLDINPNGRIPAIVDHDVPGGHCLGESGAILVYLAEKTGQFLPRAEPERSRAIQWVFWQVGHVGPMFGQLSYFARSAPERIEFAIERYRQESLRLLQILDRQLFTNEYVAGEYSIADMSLYSWIKPAYERFSQVPALQMAELGNLPRWFGAVGARPAVQIAMTRYEGTALRIGRDVEPLTAA
jgi:GSH-dependent disulfide-bond oxidoreductase